jgi:hypothetical protein
MEEVMKMLGPWPILQFMFGLAVLGGGIWAIIQGTKKKDEKQTPMQIEDRRAEWEALQTQKQILHELNEQTSVLRSIQGQIHSNAEAMRALSAAIWNKSQ